MTCGLSLTFKPFPFQLLFQGSRARTVFYRYSLIQAQSMLTSPLSRVYSLSRVMRSQAQRLHPVQEYLHPYYEQSRMLAVNHPTFPVFSM